MLISGTELVLFFLLVVLELACFFVLSLKKSAPSCYPLRARMFLNDEKCLTNITRQPLNERDIKN